MASKNKRILLTEGSSLSSRETITALSECGYQIDILSSTTLCTCAFSRWRHKIIKTVNANDDPQGYLKHISHLLHDNDYLAVVPTHEQAWLLAEGRSFLPVDAPMAVASTDAFGNTQSKISFAALLDELHIQQPQWQIIDQSLEVAIPYPFWLKSEYGTAGRTVHKVHNPAELQQLYAGIHSSRDNRLMIQEDINGRYGQVVAVFDQGKMIAVHTTLQAGRGVGDSAAARLSIDSPMSRSDMLAVGQRLQWHGAITFDFIMRDGKPFYIECNPRMVEPANAQCAGVNLPDLLIKLSAGLPFPSTLQVGRAGVKTRSTQALLLGTAEKTRKRRDVLTRLSACLRDRTSVEVLTPVLRDPPSIVPFVVVLVALLVNPRSVSRFASSAVTTYGIQPKTVMKLISQLR
ncbi:MAG: carbamoyl-phosphate-synthetase [Propionibacteriaceae bacterium]|nr:carbamoyl-phosphate-synthetase [Propionibacteriaceae bacterium]